MNSIMVYCEIDEQKVADVSLELLTKGKKLAEQLQCRLEAVMLGHHITSLAEGLFAYGVDKVYVGDDARLEPYTTLVHSRVLVDLLEKQKPQIALLGATTVGRDLGPRVSSALKSGLTADCTSLEIGDHENKRENKQYKNLLYQIRPAFGGNIIATIINPDHRPQIATVREGVMKKEVFSENHKGEVETLDLDKLLKEEDLVVRIIERHIEPSKVNIKGSPVIVSGGYGVGSKENFNLLFELAGVLGAEVGASRAAVDAGFVDHDRQIGQTGVTVRPKLYIACGISGQVQHRAGMEESAMIISVNNDENAPINKIADYVIHGKIEDVIPRMIKYYKKNTK